MLPFFSKMWNQLQQWIAKFRGAQDFAQFESCMEKHCKILCVDDDHSFCQYVQRIARTMGIQLDEAYSVSDAKRAIESSHYHAFIIDGHLPDGSGFEIVAWIREKKESNAPIGFISRIYQDSKSFRVLKDELNVDYVLDKPMTPTEVQKLFSQLCHLIDQPIVHEPFSDDLLADLKANYQKTISNKVERIEKMILDIQKEPTIEHLQVLKNEVHKIAGSAGSYGYVVVSELCKNLELDLLKQIELAKSNKLNKQWLFSLDEFFTQIKLHLQIELLEPETQNVIKTYMTSVYLVEGEEKFLNLLLNSNLNQHFDILTEKRPEKAIQTLSGADFYPQILLINTSHPSSILTGYDLLKTFYKTNDPSTTTVAIMTQEQALRDQIKALQKGMIFILTKPFPFNLILPLLNQAPFRPFPLHYKILVIDDDADICQYIIKTLKFSDLEVKTLQTTHQLDATLKTYQPDLILLNINLLDETGITVLEKLRKRLHYQKWIVGMLAMTHQDTHLIQKSYHSDVDEILFKPLEAGILQRKISFLLKKETDESLGSKEDLDTGIKDEKTLHKYLAELLRQFHVSASPKMVVIFEIESFEKLDKNDQNTVLSAVGEHLEELLQKYEMASYLKNGRFALLFQGFDPNYVDLFVHSFFTNLYSRITSILTNQFHINGALVFISEDKKNEKEIIEEGEKLLKLAKEQQSKEKIRWKKNLDDQEKKVSIYSDIEPFEVIKNLFSDHPIKVTQFSKLEEAPFQTHPILMIMEPTEETKGLNFLKKLSFESNIQIPILHLIEFPSSEDLKELLNGVNYFASPFTMAILILKP